MDTTACFLNILSSYLNGAPPEMPNDTDLENIMNLADFNNVSGIVYTQLQKINDNFESDKNYQMLEQRFLVDMMRFNRRENVKRIIDAEFKKNKIKFALVKGSTLCEYYPDASLRTMGDLDYLIAQKDKERACEIINNLGGRYLHKESQNDEYKYVLNKVYIELHTKLICDDMMPNGIDYKKYFEDEVNRLIMQDEYFGELQPERHFIFLITHMARHFDHAGCGIRMFMDIHVFKKHYEEVNHLGESLDWQYIFDELNKLKLMEFTNRVFLLCNVWFNSGFECPTTLDEKQISEMEKYVLEAGTFGTVGRNSDVMQVKRKGIFRHLFPSYSEMRQHSDWFRYKPAVLLPIAYIERIVRNARERGGIFRWGRKVVSSRKEADSHTYFMDIMKL